MGKLSNTLCVLQIHNDKLAMYVIGQYAGLYGIHGDYVRAIMSFGIEAEGETLNSLLDPSPEELAKLGGLLTEARGRYLDYKETIPPFCFMWNGKFIQEIRPTNPKVLWAPKASVHIRLQQAPGAIVSVTKARRNYKRRPE